MGKVKVSFDTWIQLLGMIGVLGRLLENRGWVQPHRAI